MKFKHLKKCKKCREMKRKTRLYCFIKFGDSRTVRLCSKCATKIKTTDFI